MAKNNGGDLLGKLYKLLDNYGYVARGTGCSHALYSYGSAGALLRKNILKAWWHDMVTTQENTFPVESQSISDQAPLESKSIKVEKSRSSLSADCSDHFDGVAKLMNHQLPFSIVQTRLCHHQQSQHAGKFLFDSGETTNMILHHYCPPSTATQTFDKLLHHRLHWWRKHSGRPAEYKVENYKEETDTGNKAEIQFMFPWGADTVETVINRGDCLLDGSRYQCKHGRKSVLPHVIECSSLLERALFTFLVDAFTEKQVFRVKAKSDDLKSSRTVLQLHFLLAPFQVAMASTGSRTMELREVSDFVKRELQGGRLQVLHSNNGTQSLETLFIRNDKLGIPFTVVMNDNTLETGIVGVRNRDTTLKEQVHITQLKDSILKYFR